MCVCFVLASCIQSVQEELLMDCLIGDSRAQVCLHVLYLFTVGAHFPTDKLDLCEIGMFSTQGV